jgi:hypothetical protein
MNSKQPTAMCKPPDKLPFTMTSIMHEKEAALEGLLRQLVGYIESVAGDDESKILSAGISVRTTTPGTQAPETPSALSATEGDHESENRSELGYGERREELRHRTEPRPTHSNFVDA